MDEVSVTDEGVPILGKDVISYDIGWLLIEFNLEMGLWLYLDIVAKLHSQQS